MSAIKVLSVASLVLLAGCRTTAPESSDSLSSGAPAQGILFNSKQYPEVSSALEGLRIQANPDNKILVEKVCRASASDRWQPCIPSQADNTPEGMAVSTYTREFDADILRLAAIRESVNHLGIFDLKPNVKIQTYQSFIKERDNSLLGLMTFGIPMLGTVVGLHPAVAGIYVVVWLEAVINSTKTELDFKSGTAGTFLQAAEGDVIAVSTFDGKDVLSKMQRNADQLHQHVQKGFQKLVAQYPDQDLAGIDKVAEEAAVRMAELEKVIATLEAKEREIEPFEFNVRKKLLTNQLMLLTSQVQKIANIKSTLASDSSRDSREIQSQYKSVLIYLGK